MPVTRKRKEDAQADPALVADQAGGRGRSQAGAEGARRQAGRVHRGAPRRARGAGARQGWRRSKLKRASDAVNSSVDRAAAEERRPRKRTRATSIAARSRISSSASTRRSPSTSGARPRAPAPDHGGGLVGGGARDRLDAAQPRGGRRARALQSLQDKEFKASMVENAAATGRTAQMVVIDPAFVPTHAAPPGRTQIVVGGAGGDAGAGAAAGARAGAARRSPLRPRRRRAAGHAAAARRRAARRSRR